MQDLPIAKPRSRAVPIDVLGDLKSLPPEQKAWAKANGFSGQSGRILLCQGNNGGLEKVLFGKSDQPLDAGKLASSLPAGNYEFESDLDDPHLTALGWMLGSYRFTQYNKRKLPGAKLVLPKGVDADDLVREVEASYLARDLINTPANDMGPDELGESHSNSWSQVQGTSFSYQGRQPAQEEFSDDPRGWQGKYRCTSIGRFKMGQYKKSQGYIGWQGCYF